MRSPLTYSAHPMRESFPKALLFWLVVAFTVWAVWWNIGSLLLTGVASLLLLASLTSFYLPTRYTLGPEGASQKRIFGSRTIEWSRVRAISDEKEGLFLSPFAGKSRMENFRGLFLPYRGNREEILTFVRQYVPEANGAAGVFTADEADEADGGRPPLMPPASEGGADEADEGHPPLIPPASEGGADEADEGHPPLMPPASEGGADEADEGYPPLIPPASEGGADEADEGHPPLIPPASEGEADEADEGHPPSIPPASEGGLGVRNYFGHRKMG